MGSSESVWEKEGTSLCEGIDTKEFAEQIYEAYGYDVTDKDGNVQEQGKVYCGSGKTGRCNLFTDPGRKQVQPVSMWVTAR